MITIDRCLRLEEYAVRALSCSTESSWLAHHLATFPQSYLQGLYGERVSVGATGAVPTAVPELLGRYWLQLLGLCVSYQAETGNYELRYLSRGQQGLNVERSAFPGDGRLGTLLRLARRVEHLHFCALSGHPEMLPVVASISHFPCVITDSDLGYRLQIGDEVGYAPFSELVPAVIAWVAERALAKLRLALGLHSKWTLVFRDGDSVSLTHADDADRKFVITWHAGVAATAEQGKPAIRQAHEVLLRAWLPEKMAQTIDLVECDSSGGVLVRWKGGSDQAGEYEEVVPFARRNLERLSADSWTARAAAFTRLIDRNSGEIFLAVGVWTNPLYRPRHGGPVQFNTQWLEITQRPQWVPFESHCRKLELGLRKESEIRALLAKELEQVSSKGHKDQ